MNIRVLSAVLGPALLAACGAAEQAQQPPLAGARIGGPFALTGEDGRRVTDRDLTGKWRVMYFGYTFCPDVCPTDVRNIAAGLKRFEAQDPARAAAVTPVFVTVDPARDTPEVLRRFTDAFHPRMLGLTGDAEAIDRTARAYAVWYRKGGTSPGGGYLIDHSRQSYLMDPQGRPVALIPQDQGPEAVAAELGRWVR